MFGWFKRKQTNVAEQTSSSARVPRGKTPQENRIGRRGICIRCGSLKSGSFVDCPRCGFMPVSDRDLAISLAVNEAEQPQKFISISKQIESGGTVQLSATDLEKLLAQVEASGVRRMLGTRQTHYVRRDRLEELLCLAARDSLVEFHNFIDKIALQVSPKHIDIRVLAGMCGISTTRSFVRSLSDANDVEYAEQALPFRIGRELSHSSRMKMPDDQRAIFCMSLSKVMEAVEDAHAEIWENHYANTGPMLAGLVISDSDGELSSLIATSPQFIEIEWCAFEEAMDDRNYGAKLTFG